MRLLIVILFGFISLMAEQVVKLNVDPVSNTSFKGKVMFGYQGWFAHPSDLSPRPVWWHWGNLSSTSGKLNVEMYPDLREFGMGEKFATAYSFPNGSKAPVFSSGNKQTVMRHIKWVRDYNTDGVFLQRFISEYGDKAVWNFRDSVASAIKQGCDKYDRVFAIMWDGVGHDKAVANIKNDWKNLVDNLGILGDSYLRHKGRPLIALWGYTFYDNATVSELEQLIDWFHNSAPAKYRASVMLGLNDNWFNKSSAWLNAFKKVEVISPWSVGRYRNQDSYNDYRNKQIKPGKNWCDSRGILFVPVIWPGFSWYNLKGQTTPKNEIPRRGGNFYWLQSYGAVASGNPTIYVAMLDELDEATAMFKTAENRSQAPAQRYWLNLDADGKKIPSDWYLRCAAKTTGVIRGAINNNVNLGTPPLGIMAIYPKDANPNSLGEMKFIFPDFDDYTTLQISLDSGVSYPYFTPDNIGTYTISDLPGGFYQVFVRHNEQMPAVDMGDVYIYGPVAIHTHQPIKSRNSVFLKNHPNPFTNYTKISFYLPWESSTSLIIFNARAQEVRKLCNQNITAGHHHLTWDRKNNYGDSVMHGVYYYQLRTDFGTFVEKMIIVK